jgi:precorrin-2 dehydrogenase/sirohydrochlorin ferrochelatase
MSDATDDAPRDDGAEKRPHPYIACLDLAGRLCVVVGGGSVAARKVTTLLDSAATVRVVAPGAVERLTMLAQVGRIELLARPYETGDLAGALLVFAATDSAEVNAQVAREARAAGALCNVADESAGGDFTVPATLRHGGLVVAVSTSGEAPGYARRIRDLVAVRLGPEYGQALDLYASVRGRILAAASDRQPVLWDSLFALDLPRAIHDRGLEAASTALSAWLRRQRLD